MKDDRKVDLFDPGRVWSQFRLDVPIDHRRFVPEWGKLPIPIKHAFVKAIGDIEYVVGMAMRDITRISNPRQKNS